METPPAEKRVLATEFKVADTEGEIEVPDLKFTFTAAGKERTDVPIDKLVQLAQRGYYNEEREQQVNQTRAEAQQTAKENAALKQYVENIQKDLTAMFSDGQDALYQNLKAQYAQANTPEAQLQRTRAELQQIQQSQHEQALMQQVQAFTTPLQQHLVSLGERHPEVSHDEIIGRFTVLTAPYLQAGRVPPSAFNQVAQLVDQELTPWVQHTHDSRATAKAQQAATTQEQIKRETSVAKAETVLAKRKLMRALPSTAGTVATPLRQAPKVPKYTKAGDILNDLERIVSQSA